MRFPGRSRPRARLALVVAAGVILFATTAWLLWGPPALLERIDPKMLERTVVRAGAMGPVLIVALMTVSVVASPVPSAPIAMASGAAYGDVWGTLLVIAGAETGALVAFGLARVLGRDVMRRWFGEGIDQGLLGSQNALTFAVFASRLMPFVSFDLISYAAGLTALRLWRFALATLAGIIPASFVLAHFGAVAAQEEAGALTWVAALGLGLVTGAPLVWVAVRSHRGRGSRPGGGAPRRSDKG